MPPFPTIRFIRSVSRLLIPSGHPGPRRALSSRSSSAPGIRGQLRRHSGAVFRYRPHAAIGWDAMCAISARLRAAVSAVQPVAGMPNRTLSRSTDGRKPHCTIAREPDSAASSVDAVCSAPQPSGGIPLNGDVAEPRTRPAGSNTNPRHAVNTVAGSPGHEVQRR